MTGSDFKAAYERVMSMQIGSLTPHQAVGLFDQMRVCATIVNQDIVRKICVRVLVLGRLKISNLEGYTTRDWARDRFEFELAT